MLSIESLDMLDSFLLLGAAHPVIAQLRLHLLQLDLRLKQFALLRLIFAGALLATA